MHMAVMLGTIASAPFIHGFRCDKQMEFSFSCRKIPMRIEPKTYFALERTYLSWMHMAVMLGGITSALVGFSIEEDNDSPAGKHKRRITKRTTQVIAMLLLPVSILMVSDLPPSALLRFQ